MRSADNAAPIAIIGTGCRLPGQANNAREFWSLLYNGRDAVREIPPERWNLDAFYHPTQGVPGRTYSKWGGFLSNADGFEPEVFGISPREAPFIDPQQRWMLEVAWEAFEDAGYAGPHLQGRRVGVFVGVSTSDYGQMQSDPSAPGMVDPHTAAGSAASIVSNRISYVFDLTGPSLSVDTACSSSLAAVHLACQALRNDECTEALAGGVNALFTPNPFIGFSAATMLSPDGRCKAFDASANGFVRAEGAGAVLLKPLARALEDGDPIHAVILGSATSQDGRTTGISAPSQEGQEAALRAAYAQGGVDPSDVGYVEAHGTGTAVGDPIEAAALGAVLGAGRRHGQACWMGSSKSNLGHMEAAAGIAGLLKAILVVQRAQVPSSLHFRSPNPAIPFEQHRLRVPTRVEPWDDPWHLAGVNSFGFGGTNAHVALGAYPECVSRRGLAIPARARRGLQAQPPTNGRRSSRADAKFGTDFAMDMGDGDGPHLMLVTARTDEALRRRVSDLAALLDARETGPADGGEEPQDPSGIAVPDLCYTMAARRSFLSRGLRVVADSREDLARRLRECAVDDTGAPATAPFETVAGGAPSVAFVFSGQGTQWVGMARRLIDTQPVFRDVFEHCDRLMKTIAGWSLITELEADAPTSRIEQTSVTQPMIFTIQVGLAALWRSWGVEPEAVLGHSVGEVAAACVSGALDLDTALEIIEARGRLTDRPETFGAMAAVGLPQDDLLPYLSGSQNLDPNDGGGLELAAINGPSLCTVTGSESAIAGLLAAMERDGVFARKLRVRNAFHSRFMEPAKGEFAIALKELHPQATRIPMISSVSGLPIEGHSLDADYWWQNVRQPVQFARGMETLLQLEPSRRLVVLELGPSSVLTAPMTEAAHMLAGRADTRIVPCLRRAEDDAVSVLEAAGTLAFCGVALEWDVVFPSSQVVRLPAMPWQRSSYWHEAATNRHHRLQRPPHPLLGRRDVQSSPSWQRLLDTRSLPYLADHRIQGRILLPGAGFLECALAAARAHTGGDDLELEHVYFDQPVLLSANDVGPVLSTSLDPGTQTFRISSRGADQADRWTEHARGSWRTRGRASSGARDLGDADKGIDLAAMRGALPEDVDIDSLYARLRDGGLEYGPAFRTIVEAWHGHEESADRSVVMGRVRMPEPTDRAEDGRYLLHPSVLDGCFQLTTVATSMVDGVSRRLFLPVGVERLRLYAPRSSTDPLERGATGVSGTSGAPDVSDVPGPADVTDAPDAPGVPGARDPGLPNVSEVWCVVRLRRETPGVIESDLELYRMDGSPLAEVLGFRCEAIETSGSQLESMRQWFLEEHWESVPPSESPTSAEVDAPGLWMLFDDASPLAEALAADLAREGHRVVRVTPGSAFAHTSEDRFQVSPESAADLDRLIEAVDALGPPWLGTIHLWSCVALDSVGTQRLLAREDLTTLSTTLLVQSLYRSRSAHNQPCLFLVTRGAQAVIAEGIEAPVHPEGAPLVGLGRTIINEYPNLRCRLIDLDPSGQAEVPAEISAAILRERAPNGEEELAWRNGERWAPRLDVVRRQLADPRRAPGEDDSATPHARLILRRAGSLDNVEWSQSAPRPLETDQVEIAVEAAALNFRDVMKTLGLYPKDLDDFAMLGDECAGQISRVGAGVTRVAPGDRVVAVAPGSFSTYAITRETLVLPLPESESFETATTIPVALLTAIYALRHVGRLRAGESVLIHSGAGGVGLAALQVARAAGARIFATAGSAEKRDYLRAQGVELVLDSRSLDFAEGVLRHTGGRGVDVILNSLAGEAIAKGLSCLAPYGRFLEIGKSDIYRDARLGMQVFRSNLSFSAIDLGRVFAERPDIVEELWTQLQEGWRDGVYAPLPHETFDFGEAAAALKRMAHAAHIGKVVLKRTPGLAVAPREDGVFAFRDDAVYWIIGGTGGLGLELARWIVGNGGRNVMLSSRRGVRTDSQAAAVEALRSTGAKVTVMAADVAERAEVDAVLQAIEATAIPLAGVFHTAMEIDDGTLLQLDVPRFRRVTRSKMLGAWNLHDATRDRALDLFVAFSSITSLVGARGQGSYVAANAYLDALARHRASDGLPALTVSWGRVSDVGYLSDRTQLTQSMEMRGQLALDPSQVTAALGRALRLGLSHVGIAKSDWQRVSRTHDGPIPRRLSRLVKPAEHSSEGFDAARLREDLQTAGPAGRALMLRRFVSEEVARVLGTSARSIDLQQPLAELGLDSLMAVDLKNRIERALSIQLPARELMQQPTVQKLVEITLSLLGLGDAGAEGMGEGGTDPSGTRATETTARPPAGLPAQSEDAPPETGAPPPPMPSSAGPTTGSPWRRAMRARQADPKRLSKDCLVRLRTTQGSRESTLFCVHPGGGRVDLYRPLAARLPARLDILGIQSPFGLDDPLPESISDLAELYAAVVAAQVPDDGDEDLRILGFSMGGLLALEIVRRLEDLGRTVAFLGIIDQDISITDPQASRTLALRQWLHDMNEVFDRELQIFERIDSETLHAVLDEVAIPLLESDSATRVAAVARFLQEGGFVRGEIPEDLLISYLARFENDARMVNAHVPRPVRAPIHLWWAETTRIVMPESSHQWPAMSTGRLIEQTLPGSHYGVFDPPQLDVLTASLSAALAGLGSATATSANAPGTATT